MSDGNFNRNPNQKPPTVLSEFALRLTGERLGENKRPPTLGLNVRRDGKSGPWVVSVDVRTNVENDKDNGVIRLLLDPPTTFMMMDLIKDACGWTEANSERIEIYNRRYIRAQNAMSKEPMLDGFIAVGRSQDGRIYLGVKHWDSDRPICKFYLTPISDYRRAVKFFHRDGNPWDPGKLSQKYAIGWSTALANILMQVYVKDFTPGEPRQFNGQAGGNRGGNSGGGWGGNRGGYGGNNNRNDNSFGNENSGNSTPSSSYSSSGNNDEWGDDIPM